jgi:general secretion pathway protein M
MKDWWQNLALREKQVLSAGTLAVIFFFLYLMVWSPLTEKVNLLRRNMQSNAELLAWMESVDRQISTLSSNAKNKPISTASILSILQKELGSSPLAAHVTQLHQAENDSVQFNLQTADFDRFIEILTELSRKYGLILSHFSAVPLGTPGEVNASVTIKAG